MTWDDHSAWAAIEAAGAKADRDDEERRRRRGLRIVPDVPPDAPEPTETADTPVVAPLPRTWPAPPPRPALDPVAGIRLFARQLRATLTHSEDDDR